MHYRYFALKFAFMLLPGFTGTVLAQTAVSARIGTGHDQVYRIGDKLPDLQFKNLINYSASQTSLNAHKGKLVIIDFWEQGCSLCMEIFPKVQKLQEKYKDKMQFITVTKLTDKKQFARGMEIFPALKHFKLPTVLLDDQLFKNFPFESISHLVWINGNGVVKAITSSDYVTEENIQLALKGGDLPWPVKNDVLNFEAGRPLLHFEADRVKPPSELFYSALTAHIDGIDPIDQNLEDTINNTYTYIRYNHPVGLICDVSLTGFGSGRIDPKLLVVEEGDKNRFIFTKGKGYRNVWQMKNSYCYTIRLPLSMTQEERGEFIKNDLTRWLGVIGITAKMEEREIPCYDLVRTADGKPFPLSKKGKEEKAKAVYPFDSSHFTNIPLASLFNVDYGYFNEFPHLIMNKTGYSDSTRVDLNFSADYLSSPEQFKKELQQYGLDLVPATTRMKVHVISDKGYSRNLKP